MVLREMAVPDRVEMFEESLVVAEYSLRPAFPTLRMEYIPQNVSQTARRAPAEFRECWEALWGQELHERLLRMSQVDMELVRQAEREILRRLDRIPRAADKLVEFKSRCARLALMSGRHEPVRVPLPVFPAAQEAGGRRVEPGDREP